MALVMYLIASKSPELSPGKLAAQVSHGAVMSVILWQDRLQEWVDQEPSQQKIVLEVKDTDKLLKVREKLEANGVHTFLVRDAGKTEIPSGTPTVLAVEIVDKEEKRELFKRLQVYKG